VWTIAEKLPFIAEVVKNLLKCPQETFKVCYKSFPTTPYLPQTDKWLASWGGGQVQYFSIVPGGVRTKKLSELSGTWAIGSKIKNNLTQGTALYCANNLMSELPNSRVLPMFWPVEV
jgi:hypothetical protein